ncbi:UbiA family prenyltransferase [Heliorestis convoluta]|uniref:4-hydroxybenzoate polyprenyltransferase n=1 Tax=Heliorestis convoluta TaxID=356322 RepID=A0A5Q2MY71_9FIRM|nr:UbiA family prenyltransferase [Heliorestis convoluta]QGG46279.1 4-hydroxybenzoate polyprenyltransferase [Heliorestis convoluta]
MKLLDWTLWISLARGSVAIRYAFTVAAAAFIENATFFSILTIAMAGFFLVLSVHIFDDIEDLPEDQINHPERPLPSGKITVTEARIFGAATLILSFSLAFFHVQALIILLLIAASVIIPPLHRILQEHWVGRSISIFLFIFSAFLLGAAATAGFPSTKLLLLALAISTLHLASRVIRDEWDLEGDTQRPLRTLPHINVSMARLWVRYNLLVASFLLLLPAFFNFHLLYLLFAGPASLIIARHALKWDENHSASHPSHLWALLVLLGAILGR